MYSKFIKTEETECRDCYKCLRECPVKAIEIKNEHATVLEELCILCGHCVTVCPTGAKNIRNDIKMFLDIISSGEKIIISLAPSYINEFIGADYRQVVKAFLKLGIMGVSETALGADAVTNDSKKVLQDGINYTSACPSAVYFIEKYEPNSVKNIIKTNSPLAAHGKMLKERFGHHIKVVFVGPCVAKKREVLEKDEFVDLALTFEEMHTIFKDKNIEPLKIHNFSECDFITEKAAKGNQYPIEDGIFKSLRPTKDDNFSTISYSGVRRLFKGLQNSDNFKSDRKVVIELFACEGGCINGPCTSKDLSLTEKIINVISKEKEEISPLSGYSICEAYLQEDMNEESYSDIDIVSKLRSIGKKNQQDELNCSGCGYDSCRDFATALLQGKAEDTMCVSYMRKLAQNKANSIVKAIPVGLVIVNSDLRIIECNRKFAEVLGEEAIEMFEMLPGLEDADLKKFITFSDVFQRVLVSGTTKLNRDIDFKGRKLKATFFSIEKGVVVGGFIQDVTEPSVARDKVIENTEMVIRKNLETVQNIAYLLGENAAETERVLTAIKSAFGNNAE